MKNIQERLCCIGSCGTNFVGLKKERWNDRHDEDVELKNLVKRWKEKESNHNVDSCM